MQLLARVQVLAAFSLVFLTISSACRADEIWICDKNVFTSSPGSRHNCELLKSSMTCGNAGNKYYAPFREGLKPSSNTQCNPDSVNSASPFVNLAFADSYSKNPVQSRPVTSQVTKRSLERPFQGLLPQTSGFNLEEIQELVKSLSSVIRTE